MGNTNKDKIKKKIISVANFVTQKKIEIDESNKNIN